MLSLSPRYDLFDFSIPKTYFPNELIEKYDVILKKKGPSVFTSSVDYLNESIVGVKLPGITDLNLPQPQISRNSGTATENRIITEPHHENFTPGSENILAKMDNQFTVTFRQNQGLLNYYFMYETTFHRYCRPWDYDSNDVFIVYLKDENGKYISKVILEQPHIYSIDGIELTMNKIERGPESFDVVFTFNNIDFDIVENEGV